MIPFWPFNVEPPAAPVPSYAPCAREYGLDGTLNEVERLVIESLAWPQSRQDIVTRFGYPKHVDANREYYRIEDSTQLLAIVYNGSNATGYEYFSGDCRYE